jgi:chemotaxis protein CheX
MIDLGLAKAKEFDVNFINPFLNATLKTFKVQCFMEAKPGKPSLKKASDPLLMGDVSGIISITSESFVGTLAISLSEAMFKVISGKMLGETCEAVTEDNVDLVGELANIILGQATIDLQKLGYGIQMALPSCVWGKDHKIKHFRSGICIVIPFETEFGTFHTEVMSNSNIANHI